MPWITFTISLIWIMFTICLSQFPENSANRDTFEATECFGSVLSLSCKAGHRIKVIDDFFGVSERVDGNDKCQFVQGDCTVTNNRYTSVIHRYCEGKQICTSFQVDRRYCGTNQTNYEQVLYECVPDVEVTNICRVSSHNQSTSGYIATPNFPHEYPPNLHCKCTLSTTGTSRIQLEATHFIVKFDQPCKDWVDITTGRRTKRLCGAYRSTLVSKTYELVFHSDEIEGHQGLWLQYSLVPPESDDKIAVQCSPEEYIPETTTSQPPTIETTTESVPALMMNTTRYQMDTTTKPNLDLLMRITTSSPIPPRIRGVNPHWNKPENGVPPAGRFIDDVPQEPQQTTVPHQQNYVHTTTTNVDPVLIDDNPFKDTDSYYDSREVGDELDTKAGKAPKQMARMNKWTGTVIICIVVGGVLIVFFSLSVALCIRRKKPEVKSSEKRQKMEQHMNSLSFYESIPIPYGRRGGVARAPPVDQSPNLTGYKNGHKENRLTEGPYWTSIHAQPPAKEGLDDDFDNDSAMYAELDKLSSKGPSAHTSPKTLPKTVTSRHKRPAPPPPVQPPSKVPSAAPEEQCQKPHPPQAPSHGLSTQYSLDLDVQDSDDEGIYTHV